MALVDYASDDSDSAQQPPHPAVKPKQLGQVQLDLKPSNTTTDQADDQEDPDYDPTDAFGIANIESSTSNQPKSNSFKLTAKSAPDVISSVRPSPHSLSLLPLFSTPS